MYTWINTECKNDEQNKCVCPHCRYGRMVIEKLDKGEHITIQDKEDYLLELYQWTHRTDKIETFMKNRYPKE